MGADLEDLLNEMRKTNALLAAAADRQSKSGGARGTSGAGFDDLRPPTEEAKSAAAEQKKAAAEQEKKAAKLQQTQVNIAKSTAADLTDPFRPRGLVAIDASIAAASTVLGAEGAQAAANLTGLTGEAFVQRKTASDIGGILSGLGEQRISVDKTFARELTKQLNEKNKIIENNLKIGKAAQDAEIGATGTAINVGSRMNTAAGKLLEAAMTFKSANQGKATGSADPSGGG